MPVTFTVKSGPNIMDHHVSWEGENVNAEYTVTWQVHGSSCDYHTPAAVDSFGLAVGQSLDVWIPGVLTLAECHDITATKEDQITTVTAIFKLANEDNPDPIDTATIWSGGFEEHEQVIDYDTSDNAILNTAGYPYLDPGVSVKQMYPTARAKKNFADLPTDLMITYANTTNSDTYLVLLSPDLSRI